MKALDIIVIAVVVLIICAIVIYLVRQKKKGAKCIGCPYAAQCSKNKNIL